MAPLPSADELLAIIAENQLSPVYQPIINLETPSLLGYEALIRGPADSSLHNPLNLFDVASRHGLMARLEYACREVSCSRFAQYGGEGKLFLNVSPMSLMEPGYQQGMTTRILDVIGLSADRIVIELSEQYPLGDYDLLRKATSHFRQMGFEIAIDDLGAGYSGLRVWSELRPDYVKIDRHFIQYIDIDPVKREFVRSIQEIARELNCKVVAEGIETMEELHTVHSLGIGYGQGYYIGRPNQSLAKPEPVLNRISHLSRPNRRPNRLSQTVGELAMSSPVTHPLCSLNEVIDLLHDNRQLTCLPVVNKHRPIGMVRRQDILELFAARYSRELHGKKPIRQFMDSSPIIVADDSMLEDVSRQLTENSSSELSQDFIITQQGLYYGVGKTSALLKKITEQQIKHARYANPLTMLPGNVPINEHLDNALKQHQNFYVAYFDLNHFKPFNDYYGYSHGDDIIIYTANILKLVFDKSCDFIGHVGGDDYVVIFRHGDWQQRCMDVMQRFDQDIKKFYSDEDFSEGGVWGKNRAGDEQFFNILSLSVGVVQPDPAACRSYHDVARLAGDAKHQAKQQQGEKVFFSRRRKPDKIAFNDKIQNPNEMAL